MSKLEELDEMLGWVWTNLPQLLLLIMVFCLFINMFLD